METAEASQSTRSSFLRLAGIAGSLGGLVFALGGCANDTSERYSCTDDGQIKVEVVEDTIPQRVISVSYRPDIYDMCSDGKINATEQEQLSRE